MYDALLAQLKAGLGANLSPASELSASVRGLRVSSSAVVLSESVIISPTMSALRSSTRRMPRVGANSSAISAKSSAATAGISANTPPT